MISDFFKIGPLKFIIMNKRKRERFPAGRLVLKLKDPSIAEKLHRLSETSLDTLENIHGVSTNNSF